MNFKRDETALGPLMTKPSHAYIVLEGEVDVEIGGKSRSESYGPGTLVGVLPLFVPGTDGSGDDTGERVT